jgi:hypothetical protein
MWCGYSGLAIPKALLKVPDPANSQAYQEGSKFTPVFDRDLSRRVGYREHEGKIVCLFCFQNQRSKRRAVFKFWLHLLRKKNPSLSKRHSER